MQTYVSILAAAALLVIMTIERAPAHDPSLYPDWSGQWGRGPERGVPRYDPSKPLRNQEAPLKPAYRARHQAALREIDAGGLGPDNNYRCFPSTMPRTMSGVSVFEFVISSSVTHIIFEQMTFSPRRVYTDGRSFPTNQEPTF